MAVTGEGEEHKVRNFCRFPFWHTTGTGISSSSSRRIHQQNQFVDQSSLHSLNTVSAMAKALIPAKRRLSLDPPNKLHFPYEPGKQVKSAIRMKNTGKSHVAFKFQTTAPKSCYMRPPGGILAPGESLIATVFKFVEHLENNEKLKDQKSRVKFKIMSLKVKGDIDYIPELFDEHKDQVAVEKILRVVFLDPQHPCPALDKLNRQLAEAEAALAARKKPPKDSGPRIVGEGFVIDEWKERRERYLARQQVEGIDSL
ncbi:vesicle-associated protein 4-1-like isoform X1 [Actinidia eriantha]|uniref:vesicle-associated protein 4-1-like isoform X1 n=1 Tax=Actinidia eriantha TaxID=165200 RepID=UPI00258EC0A3|nr:vesicle-associated protein 4-1-like isoform X1 [Actinidia eriantha]